jgi:uncharacterized protein (TIGR00299 family) protein
MPRRSSIASEAGRILYIDAFAGMAGNMFTGALLDLGLRRKDLDLDLAGLGLEYRLKVSRVRRGALAARYVDVGVPGRRRGGDRGRHGRRDAKHHRHHDTHTHAQGQGRGYLSIVELLEKADLRPPVRKHALAIFEMLARAEARVHGVALEEVHFHEVGAVDAIVDVTSAAIGIDRLGIEHISCSPVALGHGQVETDHGLLPLPAPATLELLKGMPTVPAHIEWETVTPTGAAILAALVDDFSPLPAMEIEKVGYGAGNEREGPMPNVLRLVLGRAAQSPKRDRVSMIETNLDDLVPEHFDHLMERLFDAGALDVSVQHIQMKKNRPGFLVRVLCRPGDRQDLAHILFCESSAIGVRFQDWERLVLQREQRRIDTPYGRIRVKFVHGVDGQVHVSPEYDDCKRAAKRTGVALRDVVARAEQCAREETS